MLASRSGGRHRLTEPPDPTDAELFDAWAKGHKRSGHVLFARHHDAISRFFHNKAGGETDDLVQQTFLACFEAHARFRRDASFRTFLFGIARNMLFEHFRKVRKSSTILEFDEVSVVQAGTSPSGIVAREQEQQLVRDALRCVPLLSQEVLELYYWEDLTGPELADVLGIGEPAVRSRLRRAKEHLIDQLGRLSSSPTLLQRPAQRLGRPSREGPLP
jgi:RNA polymerase sigma factor (sigma-70 family)